MKRTNYNIYIAELFSKLLKGEISPEEKLLLENWKNENEANQQLFNKLTNQEYLQEQQDKFELIKTDKAWKTLNEKLYDKAPAHRVISFTVLKYAAIISAFVIAAALLFYNHKAVKLTAANNQIAVKSNQIHPGGKHAMLILSDGHKVELGAKTRQMMNEEDGTVLHNLNNILAYNETDNLKAGDKVLYNTLVIPKGGEYQLVLADGTKVWLNSLSELRYPTKFTGSERNVYLTGEAYFEVAKNASMPFIVKTNKAEVRVLGTHFNVSAYEDDQNIKTTLLEGAVKMNSKTATAMLKPGEQAVLNNKGELNVNTNVDIEKEVAWKNGLFEFKDSDIEQIMRKAARWYDINVVYEGGISETKFTGRISRNVDLSGLIDILQFEGIKFRIEGKKVIIKK